MNREERFFNSLKDCWTGREFSRKQTTVGLIRIVNIVDDDGVQITYDVKWITKEGEVVQEQIGLNSSGKEGMKQYLFDNDYQELK